MDLKFLIILVILPWECIAQYSDGPQDGGGGYQISLSFLNKTITDIKSTFEGLLLVIL